MNNFEVHTGAELAQEVCWYLSEYFCVGAGDDRVYVSTSKPRAAILEKLYAHYPDCTVYRVNTRDEFIDNMRAAGCSQREAADLWEHGFRW